MESWGVFGWLKGSSGPDKAVRTHVETHLGKIREVLPGDAPDLQMLVAEEAGTGRLRLVTQGMSSQAMQAQAQGGGTKPLHCELMFTLPPGKAAEWARMALVALARYPFANKTFFFDGHSLKNDRIVPGYPYDGFLFGPSVTSPPEFWLGNFGRKTVLFLSVYPLYADEMAFMLQHGRDQVLRQFQRHGITDMAPDHRFNTCDSAALKSELCIEQAAASQDKTLIIKKLHEGAHLLAVKASNRAVALCQVADELGATERPLSVVTAVNKLGAQVDPVYLEQLRRRLQGMDFPPLSPKQVENGMLVADALVEVTQGYFSDLMALTPAEWTQKVPYSLEVVEPFLIQVKSARTTWDELISWCALWGFVDLMRDQSDALELAYRAVLTKGGSPARAFLELSRLPEMFRGFEDVTLHQLGANDAVKQQAALAAYWVMIELDPKLKGDVHALALSNTAPLMASVILAAMQGMRAMALQFKFLT